MPDAKPVDFTAVLASWRQEVALEDALSDLGLGETEADAWVTLAEAESTAGISRSTLRTWYRSGQMPSRLTPGPHGLQRLVPLNAVVERARRSTRVPVRATTPKEAPIVTPTTTSSRSEADAVVRLAELASEHAATRADHAEARAHEAEEALRVALERAASAETEVRLLRERLEGS